MATSRWTLSVVTVSLILLCAACSNSGSTANVTNPPPPPVQGVSIAFQSTPPASVLIGSTATFTAVVTDDSSNAGVDWSLTCQAGGTNCGFLSAPHTGSGQPVTYTPPPNLPGNAEVINVAGFATADHTQNVLTSINVSAFGNNLSGNYVFDVQGLLSDGSDYQVAGTVVLDGNGNVTSGVETVNFSGISESISITSGSTYFLGPDGRGTMTLNVSDPTISPETFSLAYVSNARALIAGTPNNTQIVSASGTLQQQASGITALTGGYAFAVSGMDFVSGGPAGIGGVLNIDGSNTISGTGSTTDQNFFNGTLTSNQGVNGTLTNPTSLGAITLTLNFPNSLPSGSPSIGFAGYMVDQNHIELVENDNNGAIVGLATAQSSSTGTFSDTSLSGNYVLSVLGVDFSNPLPNTFTSVSVLNANGSGQISNGFMDTVFQAFPDPQTGLTGFQLSTAFDGFFSVSPKGRVTSSVGGVPVPYNGFRPVVDLYLAGDGTALVLWNTDTALLFPMLATGVAYPQAANPTLGGSYASYFAQEIFQAAMPESDGTAVMTVTLPSLSGAADAGSEVDAGLSGAIGSQTCSPAVAGCFPGSFTGGFQGQNLNNPAITLGVDFYLIDSTQGFFIENDLVQQSTPQVTLGYFATSAAVQPPGSAKIVKGSRASVSKRVTASHR